LIDFSYFLQVRLIFGFEAQGSSEDWINTHSISTIILLKGCFDELGNNFSKDRTGSLQARISIYLNQPNSVIGVHHEIQTEYLKIIDSPSGIDVERRGTDYIGGNCLHFGIDHLIEIEGRVLLLHIGV